MRLKALKALLPTIALAALAVNAGHDRDEMIAEYKTFFANYGSTGEIITENINYLQKRLEESEKISRNYAEASKALKTAQDAMKSAEENLEKVTGNARLDDSAKNNLATAVKNLLSAETTVANAEKDGREATEAEKNAVKEANDKCSMDANLVNAQRAFETAKLVLSSKENVLKFTEWNDDLERLTENFELWKTIFSNYKEAYPKFESALSVAMKPFFDPDDTTRHEEYAVEAKAKLEEARVILEPVPKKMAELTEHIQENPQNRSFYSWANTVKEVEKACQFAKNLAEKALGIQDEEQTSNEEQLAISEKAPQMPEAELEETLNDLQNQENPTAEVAEDIKVIKTVIAERKANAVAFAANCVTAENQ